MITPGEEAFIREHAYLPEHIPAYGTAVSGLEPFLAGGYLYFHGTGGRLVFVGYPLNQPPDPQKMEETLRGVVACRRPAQVTILAPSVPPDCGPPSGKDLYYSLNLAGMTVPPRAAYMVRRASQGLKIRRGRTLGPGHLGLIRAFCESRKIDEAARTIFQRIPAYLEASADAAVFEARDRDEKLVAFDIADYWAEHGAFYMFNFRSCRHPFPGASDFLLQEIIAEAGLRKKSWINLGLGINAGVTFFKTKWGARPFLPHETALVCRKPPSFLESLLRGLG